MTIESILRCSGNVGPGVYLSVPGGLDGFLGMSQELPGMLQGFLFISMFSCTVHSCSVRPL